MLSEIGICVLDTRKVPRGSFLPAIALPQTYGILSEDNHKLQYCCGEYLSQALSSVRTQIIDLMAHSDKHPHHRALRLR
jgi:hypothetical protein